MWELPNFVDLIRPPKINCRTREALTPSIFPASAVVTTFVAMCES